MGIRDNIIDFLSSLFGGQSSTEGGGIFNQIFDSFWLIVFASILIILIFIIIRTIKQYTTYAGSGTELGSWKIHIQGMSTIKGNLNKNELSFSDEKIKTLLMASEYYKNIILTQGMQKIKELKDTEHLFAYDFKPTDWDDAWEIQKGNNAIILSPVMIESEKYSWQDTKGDRSITSASFRSKSRNVTCFIKSEYFPDLEDPFGDTFDGYNLTVVPKELTVKMTQTGTYEQASLVLMKLESGEALNIMSQYLPTLSETYRRVMPNEQELERLRKLVQDKDKEISEVYRTAEDDRHLAYPNPIVGYKHLLPILGKNEMLFWILFGALMGGIGYGLPDFIPSLKNSIHPLLTMFAFAVIALIVYKIFDTKKAKEEPQLEEFR